MTNHGNDPPVLVIDGAHFSDFDGFAREFSRLLCERQLLPSRCVPRGSRHISTPDLRRRPAT
ncbi:hypothetical protein [Micromonospora coerulea]|uniref:hypothetical protein n=1 Tax=Micromonospora coerulea TaxID=47856 RepID=UPI0031F998A3